MDADCRHTAGGALPAGHLPAAGGYQRIGEATEVALRVLVEKVGTCDTAGFCLSLCQPGPWMPNYSFGVTICRYTDWQLVGTLQIGLQGYASMPQALSGLSRAERITYCNDEVHLSCPTPNTPTSVDSCAFTAQSKAGSGRACTEAAA